MTSRSLVLGGVVLLLAACSQQHSDPLVATVVPSSGIKTSELKGSFAITGESGKLTAHASFAHVTNDDLVILLGRFSENMERGAIEERVRVIAKTVPVALREATFKIAMGLALVDKEAAPEEDALVGILFEGLGLTMERADALADEVRKAFA